MEFLTLKQIKVSQCIVEEHAERQMTECALAGIAKHEDDRALSKIGRKWNADEGHIAIELLPLNMALVGIAFNTHSAILT